MIEILVNGSLVAVVAEELLKVFVNALVSALPVEFSIATRRHRPQTQEKTAVSEPSKTDK